MTSFQQISLFDALAFAKKEQPFFSTVISAQNKTEVPGIDTSKWGDQLKAVFNAMRDGRWRTLAEISFLAKAPEASVSARLRQLSKKGIPHFKRKAKDGKLFEYQLTATTGNSSTLVE